MDHEVISRLYRICDWMLNSSRDHFGLRQGKYVIVIMEFKVPRRHISLQENGCKTYKRLTLQCPNQQKVLGTMEFCQFTVVQFFCQILSM